MDPLEEEAGSATAEAAYRWTVRGLYIALIAANLFVIWDTYSETPEVLVLRARIRRRWEALKNCEACAQRREALRAAANRVLFEAETVKEEAWRQQAEAAEADTAAGEEATP